MSGTSADGIDAALVDFSSLPPKLVATHKHPMPDTFRHQIIDLSQSNEPVLPARLARLDIEAGQLFGAAAQVLLQQAKIPAQQVQAIGSHGQTLYHAPSDEYPYTWQIGDPNTIAQLTGITTVADFRRRDMAAGGQGAPLVPLFHSDLFRSRTENRVVLNIGGIANITVLYADTQKPLIGFDTGPGNALLDAWAARYLNRDMDSDGAWGKQGKIQETLVQTLLEDPYFSMHAPKSTGRDYFNLNWLNQHLKHPYEPQDIQASLVQLTVCSIAEAACVYSPDRLLVCGGGAHNPLLMKGLSEHIAHCTVVSTGTFGVDPDWVEAMCFAWLAKQRLELKPGNSPQVTGATASVVLGGVYAA